MKISKKSVLIVIFFALLFIQASEASRIKVDVSEDIRGDFVFVNYTVGSNTVNVTAEFYNTGSVAYGARLRLIINEKSVWTGEEKLYPGNKAFFQIQATSAGNVTAKLHAYYGNEILEGDEANLTVPEALKNNAFGITNFRTYPEKIEFDLKSSEDVVAIFEPLRYPPSWIFEGTKIGHVKNNTTTKVSARYVAPLLSEDALTFAVFSEDGLFYTEHVEKMEIREDRLSAALEKISRVFQSPLFLLLNL